jgi:hypothetical protein
MSFGVRLSSAVEEKKNVHIDSGSERGNHRQLVTSDQDQHGSPLSEAKLGDEDEPIGAWTQAEIAAGRIADGATATSAVFATGMTA